VSANSVSQAHGATQRRVDLGLTSRVPGDSRPTGSPGPRSQWVTGCALRAS